MSNLQRKVALAAQPVPLKTAVQVPYPEITIKGKYLWHKEDPKKPPVKFAQEFHISEVLIDIDNDEVKLVLEFQFNGKTVKKELYRNELKRNKLTEYAKYGVYIFDHNFTLCVKHLLNEEIRAPKQYVHHRLGWMDFENQLVFKHGQAVGINSTYKGKLQVQPMGTFLQWKQVIEENVIGQTPLELAVLFGLSSAVVGLIGKETELDSLFIHIYGNSTQGKTTATSLAISTYGYPGTRKNGLMKTWLGTSNAIVSQLNGNHGVVIGFDEASMSAELDFSNFIYRIAGGIEKARLDSEGELKEFGSWSTTVISNGEFALTTKAKQNMGIRMRVFEFGNVQWTISAVNADAIKNVILKNNGHAGFLFAQELHKLGSERLLSLWKNWIQTVLANIPESSKFSERIAAKLALIMVTGEIAQQALGLNFNLNNILHMLISNENLTKKLEDLGQRALDFIIDQVAINRSQFLIGNSDGKPLGKILGKIIKKDGVEEICIIKKVFSDWLKEGGFEDPNVVLSDWKNRNLLDSEEDRYTRKRKIGESSSTTVYCIKVPLDQD